MDENQKPFACTIDGCEMTFTNEDHLNWHHKKHDMVLNLGLANKNIEVADQTPTPTRFIRNCEEVGLFQDLQNVNPFDETFKKAIESAKSGTLHVPESTCNDDTLHTPHIFPHVENTNKYVNTSNNNQSTRSNGFCIDTVPSIDDNNEPESYDLTIETDEAEPEKVKNKHNELKTKLKETIQNKVKTPAVITPVPLDKLILNKNDRIEKRIHPDDNTNKKQQIANDEVNLEKAKIREMNRAAQFRCRKRKQIQWRRMEDELKSLKNEMVKVNQENQNLKHKIYAMKEILLKHKKSNGDNASVLNIIEDILNSPSVTTKKAIPKSVMPIPKVIKKEITKTPPILPVPNLQNPLSVVQKPVVIQLVAGSVAQLAVSIIPNK